MDHFCPRSKSLLTFPWHSSKSQPLTSILQAIRHCQSELAFFSPSRSLFARSRRACPQSGPRRKHGDMHLFAVSRLPSTRLGKCAIHPLSCRVHLDATQPFYRRRRQELVLPLAAGRKLDKARQGIRAKRGSVRWSSTLRSSTLRGSEYICRGGTLNVESSGAHIK